MKSSCRSYGSILVSLLVLAARCLALYLAVLSPLATLHAQSNYATPYTSKTIAGSGGNSSSTNGTGTAASFLNPSTVAVDSSGNLYVTDTGNNLIRKITSAGVVTILAGSVGSVGSVDGIGSAARFSSPQGIAIDASDNIYVADGAYTVRKITPAGVVTTLAGEAEIIGSSPGYSAPMAIAADGAGNVYVADNQNSVVRKISPLGVVTILAGTVGVYGSADGTGADASFYAPQGIAVDSSGNVYVADTVNATIRKITPAGVVTTLAGSVYGYGSVDGAGTGAQFNYPMGLTADAAGNLYVADGTPWGSQTSIIRKVTAAGVVTTLAGGLAGYADGAGTAAKFNILLGVAADNTGNVYVADPGNQMVRRMTSGGTVTTFAGGGGAPGFVDGQGSVARFNGPSGVAMDNAGNILIADMNNHAIRRMTPAGVVTTAKVGLENFYASTPGLAADGMGNSYSVYGGCQIAKTTPLGVFTILAGIGYSGSADGPGQYASFSYPQGLAVDAAGNVYVADSQNSTIRKISSTGNVTTLAGLAENSGGDDGTGSSARFYYPVGVALDTTGNLYVTDLGNSNVRRITPAGVVTTLAGTVGDPGDTDGSGSVARFSAPSAIAVDASGNIFVTDVGNHNIRKITPAGVVTTLGGQTGFVDYSTGVGPAAHFPNPTGIAVDSLGQIYVADSVYNSIVVGGIVVAPAITVQPTNQSAIETQPVSFSVTATGGVLSYQWRKGGVALPGANSPTLMLDSPATADAGSYDVVITNPQGSVASSAVTLTVAAIPVITSLSPVRQVLTPGQNLSLAVTATGTGTLTYQWYRNGTLLAGATANTYAVTGVTTQNSGWYRVTITDNIGTRRSAALFVAVAPAVTQLRAWGSSYGQTQADEPNNLTDVIAISSSGSHALALRNNGTVTAWGINTSGQTNVPAGLSGVVAVSAGGGASLALKSDGTVVAWGDNSENQTGVPAGLAGVVAISAGFRHCLALKSDGTVVAWGSGWYGETAVPAGLSGVRAISAGMYHSTALKNDGTVAAWGDSTYGAQNIPNGLSGVTTISGEGYHTLALKNDGTVVAWGSNSNGESTVPSGLSGVVGIASSSFVSFALKSNGTVFGWGDNSSGAATPPADLANVVSVSKALALRDGTGDTLPNITTQPVNQAKLEGQDVSFSVAATGAGPLSYQWRKDGVNISGATSTTLALTNLLPGNSGNYDVLARNYLGVTTSAVAVLTVNTLPIITGLSPARQVLAPGQVLNLGVTATGTGALAYQWIHNGVAVPGATGANYSLSNATAGAGGWYVVSITDTIGTRKSSARFVLVVPVVTQVVGWGIRSDGENGVPAALSNVVGLAIGSRHMLALKRDGTVIGWGGNSSGETAIPAGLTGVVQVAAGESHSYALKSDGTVVGWGRQDSTAAVNVPAGLTNVVMISAGTGHVLALKDDGAVVAWGSVLYSYGQSNVPAGLTGVTQVSAGAYHSLALKSDGTVVTWGSEGAAVPAGLSGVVAISAGSNHDLALKSDGTVVAWGSQTTGFGENVVPAGLSGVTAISSGWYHSLALRNNGTIRNWGQNLFDETIPPAGLSNVIAVAGGDYTSFVLRDASLDPLPSIGTSPANKTVWEAEPVSFAVAATGSGPLVYQWRKNAVSIAGATAATLAIAHAATADAGSYDVVVSNHVGSVTSSAATLIVKPIPLITGLSATRQVLLPAQSLNLSVSATGNGALSYQWIHNGIPVAGATGSGYSVASVTSRDSGWYVVLVTDSRGTRRSAPIFVSVVPLVTQVRGWGYAGTQALTGIPAGLNDVIAVDAGPAHVLALKRDGSVIGWGFDYSNSTQTPSGLSDVVAVSAGSTHSLALKNDGTVVAWGQNSDGQASVPAGLSDVVAVAAGYYYSLALKSDGTVVSWGNGYGGTPIPAGLAGVVAISAGSQTPLALKNDGTAVSWGIYGNTVPNIMTNLSAISVDASNVGIVGLKNDGTVIADPFAQWKPPVGLTGVVAISTGSEQVLALKNDGSVVGWGYVPNGAATPPVDLAKVLAISAGGSYSLALCDATPVRMPVISTQPVSQSVGVDGSVIFTAVADGYPIPLFQWQKNGVNIVGATGGSYTIANVASGDAGNYTVIVTNSVGSVTSNVAVLTPFIAAPSNAIISFSVE